MMASTACGLDDSRIADTSHMLPCSPFTESRDSLRAMIELEQNYYQRSSYLFPSDCDVHDHEEAHGAFVTNEFSEEIAEQTTRSSLSMIQEMANLVTDLEDGSESKDFYGAQEGALTAFMSTPNLPSNDKKCYHKAHSPTSSTFDLYDEKTRPFESSAMDSKPPHATRRRPSALEISCLSNWRHQMLDWTCSVCQSFLGAENASTVLATTFSILDRYLSIILHETNILEHEIEKPLGISREEFQLFCMVSLYIAAKTVISAEYNKLTIPSLVAISRKLYTAEDISSMEREILLTLDWHVNPPTVSCFCKIFLDLFPFEEQDSNLQLENGSQPMSSIARHKCEYLAELALDDVFFLDKAAFTVGLAVVVLVTDSLRSQRRNPMGRRHRCGGSLSLFLQNIQGIVNVHNSEFDSILRRLECFMKLL